MLEVGVPDADAAEADLGGLLAAVAEVEQRPLAPHVHLDGAGHGPVEAHQLDVAHRSPPCRRNLAPPLTRCLPARAGVLADARWPTSPPPSRRPRASRSRSRTTRRRSTATRRPPRPPRGRRTGSSPAGAGSPPGARASRWTSAAS